MVTVCHSKNPEAVKLDGTSIVRDRESNSLSLTVEFFLIAVFFRGKFLYYSVLVGRKMERTKSL